MLRYLTALIPLLLITLLLSTCSLLENDAQVTAEVTEPELPTPANTPDSLPEAGVPSADVANSPQGITLTLWTVPEISPRTEVPGGAALLDQLNAFDTVHPDLNLYIELKTVSGQGGMLNYLRTGRGVAPRVLPDVIILPAETLSEAVVDGLVFPLDDLLLDEDMITDLYPAAQQLASVGDTLYAYPLTLSDLGHIAYDGNSITRTVPLNWETFTELENGQFVFPANGTDGAKLALQFYLEAGGTLINVNGAPQLEVEPLTAALEAIDFAVDSGFVLPASGEITTLAESWQIFQNGDATITQTNAEQFLSQRNLGISASFAPIPGVTTTFPPMTGAWAMAITTSDNSRQAIAAELISWLGSAANMGEWSRQSGRVPARETAFEAWPADDPYVNFLRRQVTLAKPFPKEATSAILSALTEAVSAVVQGTSTPATAAQAASQDLRP